VTEIDRDLLAVRGFWPELMYIRSHAFHPVPIQLDGTWMAMALLQGATASHHKKQDPWTTARVVGGTFGLGRSARRIQVSADGRAGAPDEVGTVGVLLIDPDGRCSPCAPR
jgi:hypothetical protein